MCVHVYVCVSLKQHVVAAKKKSEHTMFNLLNNNVIEKFKSVIMHTGMQVVCVVSEKFTVVELEVKIF